MRAAPLSGDWRRIGGNLEMVAALHVNTAGFPIPRMLAASLEGREDEEMLSLVAAGSLARVAEDNSDLVASGSLVDMEALGRAVARGMRAEQQEAEHRAAVAAEWERLVAAATAPDLAPEYDDALRDLTYALNQE